MFKKKIILILLSLSILGCNKPKDLPEPTLPVYNEDIKKNNQVVAILLYNNPNRASYIHAYPDYELVDNNNILISRNHNLAIEKIYHPGALEYNFNNAYIENKSNKRKFTTTWTGYECKINFQWSSYYHVINMTPLAESGPFFEAFLQTQGSWYKQDNNYPNIYTKAPYSYNIIENSETLLSAASEQIPERFFIKWSSDIYGIASSDYCLYGSRSRDMNETLKEVIAISKNSLKISRIDKSNNQEIAFIQTGAYSENNGTLTANITAGQSIGKTLYLAIDIIDAYNFNMKFGLDSFPTGQYFEYKM